MSSIAANAANNICGEILGVGAVVLAVADFTAVLASLILVVTESTVKRGELTKLIALQLVLALRNGGSLRIC